MTKLVAAAAAVAFLGGAAMTQAADAQMPTAEQIASLSWMEGTRVHTNANGSKVLEAFIGPINGVVTGTALAPIGTDRAYTEYHKIGPNPDGVYGLAVANTRSNMQWNFTPLQAIEPGRITFRSTDGKLTIVYYSEPGGGVGSQVVRVMDGKTMTQDWHFKPLPAPR
jgi:hypothetical protein